VEKVEREAQGMQEVTKTMMRMATALMTAAAAAAATVVAFQRPTKCKAATRKIMDLLAREKPRKGEAVEEKVPGTPAPRASVSTRKMNQEEDVKEGKGKVVEEVKDVEEGWVVT
jgi:hypothetical protein